MGTRSLTHFIDDDGVIFFTLYRQYDGYPTGMGKDIKDALGGRPVVNGYNDPAKQINTIHSAPVMLVASLAEPGMTGGYYIYKPGHGDYGQDYSYTLCVKNGVMHIVVDSYGRILYNGPLDDFDPVAVEEKDNSDED